MERIVTISASYGAGGSVIAPAVAKALDVPFLDRAVPARAAVAGALPVGEGVAPEERTRSLVERVVATFANLPDAFGPGAPPTPVAQGDEDLRRETAARVRAFVAEHGAGVVLGWGATALLPDALHVRLDGPPDRRALRAAEIEGIEPAEAQRRLTETDRIRSHYLKRLYNRDWNDLRVYHLVLDSTALDFEDGTALVVCAAKAFWRQG